jgi:hypothetical protein
MFFISLALSNIIAAFNIDSAVTMGSRRTVLSILNAEESNEPLQRRPRYAGRYPRNFAEKYKEHNGDADTISKVLAKGMTPAGKCDVCVSFVVMLFPKDKVSKHVPSPKIIDVQERMFLYY